MEIYIVDAIVVLVLLFFAIRCFMGGIIREILYLASWGVTIYLTMYTYGYFIPFFTPYIESENVVIGTAVVTTFIVYFIVFYLISSLINRMLSISVLTPINKSLGFVFGIGEGLLILSIFYMGIAGVVQDRMPKIITNAKSEPVISWVSNKLVDTFPEEVRTTIIEKLRKAGQAAADVPVIKNKLKQGKEALKDAVKT